jgi:hypothetical protein
LSKYLNILNPVGLASGSSPVFKLSKLFKSRRNDLNNLNPGQIIQIIQILAKFFE